VVVVVNVNNIPAPPNPAVTSVIHPDCIITTGTISIISPQDPKYKYSIGTGYQTSPIFSLLPPGTSYNVTIKDTITGCVSSSIPVSINNIPGQPNPAVTSVIQPNCIITTGTISITSPLDPKYKYSIGAGYQSSPVFTLLPPGTNYTVTIKDTTTGCISLVIPVGVNAIPAPPNPAVTNVIQPNCIITTGTISIISPQDSKYKYSIGAGYQSSPVFALLTPGTTYNVTIKDTVTGCVSLVVPVFVNAIPAAPVSPVANVTFQPTCLITTGTIVVSSPLSGNYQYSIDGVYQPFPTFSGVASGAHNITVKDVTTGCISAATPVYSRKRNQLWYLL